MIVRNDFFAGIAGNRQAFERAMAKIEEALAKNPKHAEAKVWHGSGVFYRSADAFQKGDFQNVIDSSISELERKLDPEIFIRIHRSTLLNVRYVNEMNGSTLRLKDARVTELQIA